MNRNKESSRQLHKLWLELIKLGNVILITLPFGICWYLYYVDRLALNYYRKGISVVILIFAILYLALGRTYSAFQISLHRRAEVVYSQALAEIFSDFIMYLIIFLLNITDKSGEAILCVEELPPDYDEEELIAETSDDIEMEVEGGENSDEEDLAEEAKVEAEEGGEEK